MDIESTQRLLERYLREYPNEAERQSHFSDFLRTAIQQDKNIFDKQNQVGHLTASALVIHPDQLHFLALWHKTLKRFLQPGGHIEPDADGSMLAAAIREVEEETGISADDLLPISPGLVDSDPLDIDTHAIAPANNVDGHYHFDFRFVFLYKGDLSRVPEEYDGTEIKWSSLTELPDQTTHQYLLEKLRHLLSYEFRQKQFYDVVVKRAQQAGQCLKSIVVSHIIPDCYYYLQAVDAVYPILAVIPKPNSIDAVAMSRLENDFPIHTITRTELALPHNSLTTRMAEVEEGIVLFDIGGYFTQYLDAWPPEISARVRMVVEDTENGHQKYAQYAERRGQRFPAPIVSVARSPLKDNEDYLVGQSVLYSADALLREVGALIQYLRCSVIGYGKIGKSIAHHLLQRGVKPMVYDSNPLKRIEAFNHQCSIPDRDDIIRNSEVVFSATGNRCLNINDFRKLKSGCIVFSVTSSDDEMDQNYLQGEFNRYSVTNHITKYSNDQNFFFFAKDGNAVNFTHNAVMGDFIHLVRSEMILAPAQSSQDLKDPWDDGLLEIPFETRRWVAETWLSVFDPENRQISSFEFRK